jgi:2-keto-4-pentenoate hydratase
MEKLLELRSERQAAGDRPIGWKLAFAAPAFQKSLQLTGPLVAYLPGSGARQSGDEISVAGWVKPVVEPEVAVYLGKDVAAGADRAAALSAIATLGPAIEVVDFVSPPVDVEEVLAGNIFHRNVVLGPARSVRIEDLTGRVFRRGDEVARTSEVQALTGDIVDLVCQAANYVNAFGQRLRAGDVVICGSIVPPVTIDADEAEFGYALDPVGEISVRFKRSARGRKADIVGAGEKADAEELWDAN